MSERDLGAEMHGNLFRRKDMAAIGKRRKGVDARPGSVELHEPDIMRRIAETAHDLWEKRGGPHGNDMQDWIEAEKIVTGRK